MDGSRAVRGNLRQSQEKQHHPLFGFAIRKTRKGPCCILQEPPKKPERSKFHSNIKNIQRLACQFPPHIISMAFTLAKAARGLQGRPHLKQWGIE
jgi:hypothetical protein